MKTKALNPVDVHVGSRVRMRRMMLGMTQEELAKAFGLTFQQVQKYEKGLNRMASSRLQQAAEVLRVVIPFFFEDGSGGQVTAGTPPDQYITDFVCSHDA
jgi:transcriptional regulator with XRE-family HTH domain